MMFPGAHPWIAWVILLPLAAAIAAVAFRRAAAGVGGLTAAGVVVGATGLVWQVARDGAQRHAVGGWGAPLGIDLRADGLGALLVAMTAVIGLAVSLYALRYFSDADAEDDLAKQRHKRAHFWPLWLFLWAALNALFLSADVFNLYVTLELLGFAAVALVALDGQRAAVVAAMRYLLVSLLGSLCFLLGVALLYAAYATVDLALLAQSMKPGPPAWAALALMTAGLLIKGALFPVHFWLPPAHANAPAPVSALLSALVVKAAFYILLRLWFEAFADVAAGAGFQLLGVLGAAAVFWGSIQALRQTRLKLLVAYSTVAQLGYLFLLFPLARAAGFDAWSGALYFLLAHACAKTAMFLTAGNILHAAGHDRLEQLDGFTHTLPLSAFAFGLAGISLVGLPPSGGFIGKWLLLTSALRSGQWWWAVVLLLGSLLAAAYLLRVLWHAFTRVRAAQPRHHVPRLMEWTALGLALGAVILGFTASAPVKLLRVGAPVALENVSRGMAESSRALLSAATGGRR